jgi:hypothetical protein
MPWLEAPYVHSPEVKIVPSSLLCARYFEVHECRITDGSASYALMASALCLIAVRIASISSTCAEDTRDAVWMDIDKGRLIKLRRVNPSPARKVVDNQIDKFDLIGRQRLAIQEGREGTLRLGAIQPHQRTHE